MVHIRLRSNPKSCIADVRIDAYDIVVQARVIHPGGKAICFGWNSNGIGKKRGFRLDRLLVIAHGSRINDTLVTVETKVQGELR